MCKITVRTFHFHQNPSLLQIHKYDTTHVHLGLYWIRLTENKIHFLMNRTVEGKFPSLLFCAGIVVQQTSL